jgi:hypothetical protein
MATAFTPIVGACADRQSAPRLRRSGHATNRSTHSAGYICGSADRRAPSYTCADTDRAAAGPLASAHILQPGAAHGRRAALRDTV